MPMNGLYESTTRCGGLSVSSFLVAVVICVFMWPKNKDSLCPTEHKLQCSAGCTALGNRERDEALPRLLT